MLIDTHCHLFNDEYEDLYDVINEIKNNKIIVIVNGYDKNTNREAIELAKKHDFIYASVGYHPSNLDSITEEDLIILEEQLKEKKVVAVGEIGLDYYWTKETKENQIKYFKLQLELAQKYNMPVIVHNRDATMDVIELLSSYTLKGVVHAFSGSIETAALLIKMGFLLGIGGVVTFKNSNLKEVVKNINIENILLETDSPYLTPEPYRGKKNKPIYVRNIAMRISEIKNIKYEDVCKATLLNAVKLFDLV